MKELTDLPFVALGDNEVQAGTDGLLAADLLEELGGLGGTALAKNTCGETERMRASPRLTVIIRGFCVLAYGNGFCGNFSEELFKDGVMAGEVRDIGQVVGLGLGL